MLLLKKYSLITFLLVFATIGWGQAEKIENKEMTRELGLNVTTLLADLLGNNNRTDAGRYLLSYKKLNGATAFRLGVAVNFDFNKERDFFNNTFVNQNIQLRMGKEWRHDINSKLQYYFGFDGVGGMKTEESAATANSGTLIQKNKDIVLGCGPVLGFQFAIFDKLLLGTEGSLCATYINQKVSFRQNVFGGNPPALPPSRKNDGFSLKTTLPTSLFLILKF